MMKFQNGLLMLVFIFALGCDQGANNLNDVLYGDIRYVVNPHKRVPLGATIQLRTKEPSEIEATILGKIPLKKVSEKSDRHSIDLIGLYAGRTNRVALKVKIEDDVYYDTLRIPTDPIPSRFPQIEISKIDRDRMEPGFHLVELLLANNGRFHTFLVVFDDNADVRWYLDMSEIDQISYSSLKLSNGNWFLFSWINLWQMNDLGQTVATNQMWNYAANHDALEMADGSLLMAGSGKDTRVKRADGIETGTRYDHVVQWDLNKNEPVKAWDLGEVLDIDRLVYPEDFDIDFKTDWIHINDIALDPRDNAILVSGRNQGVIKVDQNNEVKWVLAPHAEWGNTGRSGKGPLLNDKLLTAVDEDGNVLPEEVQNGYQGTENFEWPTGQHAINLLPNGNLLLFDNGMARNLEGKPTYSRAVEYRINEQEMTVQQVWQYGKERGLGMFSRITSDVDVLPTTGNRLITVGNIRASEEAPHAKIIEITHPENEVVFEAKLYFKDESSTGENAWGQLDAVFRSERFNPFQ